MTDNKSPEQGRTLAAGRETTNGDSGQEEFLAALAHELRDPLAPICAGLELLKLARDKLEPYDEIISMMERQTRQLVTLVDHLLDISRISRGTLELERRKVKLRDVVQDAVADAEATVREAGQQVALLLPERAVYLEADPRRLTQALSHLLCCAARNASSAGCIRLELQAQGGEGLICIRYQGKPLAEEREQGGPAGEESGGARVGLSLVRFLAEMHGGGLEVRREGLGCEFVLRLPVLDIMAAERRDEKAVQSGRRVLVVDDNRDAASMLGKVIELLGHESRTASDGRMAVEAAARFRPEVVLMDLDMPEMDGFEAARRMREQDWGRDLVLVALTGWGQEKDRRRAREAGFDHHLLKPVEPTQLQSLLTGVESRRQSGT